MDTEEVKHFDTMERLELRNYITKAVKEVNKIKHKLKTRNSYFKGLYNKFVKQRMKKAKTLDLPSKEKGAVTSPNSRTTTPTPIDFSSDDSNKAKEKLDRENAMNSEYLEVPDKGSKTP